MSGPLSNCASLAQLQELARQHTLVVAHFWASWCEPCTQMDAVMEKLAADRGAKSNVAWTRVEAEEVDDASAEYQIISVPTILVLKGAAELARVEGADPAALASAVTSALGQADSNGYTGLAVPNAATPDAAKPAKAVNVEASAPSPTLAPEVEARIKILLASHPVCLFMKGTVEAPRCGFSRRVVQALHSLGASVFGVDVLSDEGIRTGLKLFSNWPTFPQLYIKQELIGGCDIVEEMLGNGELKQALEEAAGPSSA